MKIWKWGLVCFGFLVISIAFILMHPWSQYKIGLALAEKYPKASEKWLLKASLQGHREAQKRLLELGVQFEPTSLEDKFILLRWEYETYYYDMSFEEISKLAYRGEREFPLWMSMFYYDGLHIERDLIKAYAWLKVHDYLLKMFFMRDLTFQLQTQIEQMCSLEDMKAGDLEAERIFKKIQLNLRKELFDQLKVIQFQGHNLHKLAGTLDKVQKLCFHGCASSYWFKNFVLCDRIPIKDSSKDVIKHCLKLKQCLHDHRKIISAACFSSHLAFKPNEDIEAWMSILDTIIEIAKNHEVCEWVKIE